ncbi:hypothetical protein BEL05_14925 [Shewanella colwelliana]|uniref:Uncharacterized protein n=1 Tax=Shewanella colwelliana TaxID=23 RepID=A0A1E5IT57_SHECO|nr:hypothetical protein [Shewanella colwelliana]OEG73744.1 hypothetical protein BEL05_14925 [Shewanella colwelliana]
MSKLRQLNSNKWVFLSSIVLVFLYILLLFFSGYISKQINDFGIIHSGKESSLKYAQGGTITSSFTRKRGEVEYISVEDMKKVIELQEKRSEYLKREYLDEVERGEADSVSLMVLILTVFTLVWFVLSGDNSKWSYQYKLVFLFSCIALNFLLANYGLITVFMFITLIGVFLRKNLQWYWS